MFIEPTIGKHGKERGWVEVICGSMFSGKTEELIRRLNRAKIAKQKVEIFKPSIDTRYHKNEVVSHDERTIRSTPVQFAKDILLMASDCQVVGIDEGQFFDSSLVEVVNELAESGKRVLIAGLDMDFSGQPFEPIPSLMAIAEYVTKVHAVCAKCGTIASYSFRLLDNNEKVVVGEKEAYEARCRPCFVTGMKTK